MTERSQLSVQAAIIQLKKYPRVVISNRGRDTKSLEDLMQPQSTKLCPQCGEPVVRKPRRPAKTFCSQTCSNRAHAVDRKGLHLNLTTRDCLHCGTEFAILYQSRHGQHFCSQSCSYAHLAATRAERAAQRFWSKVDRSGGPDACWPWTGALSGGYGVLGVHPLGNIGAHRFSYELANGPIPSGLMACHSCDVKRCVNPGHLFLGTAKENSGDMTAKQRQSRGERRPAAKLTDHDVLHIRELFEAGVASRDIAERHGVSVTTVELILRGKTWRHVEPEAVRD